VSGNRGIRVNFFVINLLNCLMDARNRPSRAVDREKTETKKPARNSRKAKK
jgi:hypothetical protein